MPTFFGSIRESNRRPWLTKAWTTVAQEIERKAEYNEKRGFRLAAPDLFQRATLLYARAQYTIFADDPLKTALYAKAISCYEKVMQSNPTKIERVQIPYEGKTVYAVLHLPKPIGKGKVPCIVMAPGMDSFKEDLHNIAQQYFLPRGMAFIAMDGPGQGESLLHGLKAKADNYELAAKRVIDYAVSRPEIDPGKIGTLGFSMGSYWATRITAYDKRVKAGASALGCYGTTEVIFNQAQPNYKRNFMFMSGIPDEQEFDEKVARKMHLRDVAPRISCPYLMITGEYDELCPLKDALATYELVKPPKEIWVYDNEFHPLGGVASEMIVCAADWLEQMLNGKYDEKMDRRLFVTREGYYSEGTAKPAWWPKE